MSKVEIRLADGKSVTVDHTGTAEDLAQMFSTKSGQSPHVGDYLKLQTTNGQVVYVAKQAVASLTDA